MVEKYGWDQTPTPDLGLDITKAPSDIQKLYKWVIEKTYGEDVASAYAQGLVAAGIIAKNAEAMSLFTSGQMDELKVLVDDMLLEMTGKDVISAPEIIQMRDGEATANDRLVRDYNNLNEQLVQTTPEIYLDTLPRLAPEVVDNFRIQRAIDSLEGTGGTVKLGVGEYVVNDTIQMGFGITLEGVNQYATKIKTNVDKAVFNIGHPDNFIFYTAIQKMHIEGNSTGLNQTAIHYTGRNPAYSIIDDVMITDMGGYGVRGGHDGHVNNVEVTRCFIENCGIDGIDFSYGEGQINAIWIHRNNVVKCKTGIRFFGNNVIVESNTVQSNDVAFSVGDSELLPLGVGIGFYCMGSVIEKNYTEKNGKVIEIFHSYTETDPTTKSRIIRQLEIKNNYLAETGVDAIIEVFDISTSQPQHGNGSVIVKNNFGEKPIIKLNKPTALSYGSVIDESRKQLTPTSLIDSLPDWVEVRGYVNDRFKVSKTNLSLQSGWTPYNQGTYISKDKNGLVELHFSATAGTIDLNTTVAVLPQGLRPKNSIILPLYSPSTGAYQGKGLVVQSSGEIKVLFGDQPLTSGHVYSGMIYYKT